MILTNDDKKFLAECGIKTEALPDTATIRENDYANFELVVNGLVLATCSHPNPLYSFAVNRGLEIAPAF